MATYSNTAREVEMPNGDVVVIHNAPTGGENTTSNIKKFKYDDNGHVTESTAANATDLNLNSYSTPTTGSTAIGTSDAVQTAIGKLDHQSQIDQTNILYAINKVGKNVAKETTKTIDILAADHYRIYCDKISGSIHIHFDSLTSTDTDSTTIQANLHYTDGTTGSIIQFERGTNINVDVNAGNKVVDWLTIFAADTWAHSADDTATATGIVICPQDAWTNDPTFTPYALPNYDLTYLQAEDRAALAEVVDSGAKNELQPTWTTQTINGVTFTVGSDGVITATTTGTRTSAAIYPLLSRYSGTKMAGKVMSISPKGGTNASYYVAAEQADSPWHNVGTDYGDGVVISSEANNKDINVNIVIPANYSPNNLKFSPMVATKAAFGVSQKFVPYRPDMYDYQWQAISTYLLARRSGRTITINGYIANISFTANTATLIGNVNTTVGRPHESVRTLCNVGANAYTVGTLGYLILQQDGNIYVTTAYEGTGAVYVSLSYTI